jgi:Leucine-rich repeat (LRR) protein
MMSTSTRRGVALFLGLLLLPLLSTAQTDQARDDTSTYHLREILLNLYQATGGLDWTFSDNWFQQRAEVCTWHGVICYSDQVSDERLHGQIRELDLRSNHLVGTVPTQVFEIPYLQSLQLDGNTNVDVDLSGLRKANFLTRLELSDTQVSNLATIGDAQNLEVLHLTNLNLRGKLPAGLFTLTSLLALFANDNLFTGRLPTEIGKLSKLDELYLFENDMTGQIPTEIGLLTGLQILALSQNAFGGTLPSQLNFLTGLQILALQRVAGKEKGPGISGSLPALDNIPALTQVNLENQKLSGLLNQNFLKNAPTSELVRVDLSNNDLSGTVPSQLVTKDYLNLLLADNKIDLVSSNIIVNGSCPNIPNWMGGDVTSVGCNAFLCPSNSWAPKGRATEVDTCQPCNFSDNYLGHTSCSSTTPTEERQVLVNMYNRMGGPHWKQDVNWLNPAITVCDWFGIDCTTDGQVQSIVMKNNGLTDGLPTELFSLPALKVLNLSANSISFSFDGINKVQTLEVLDLSNIGLVNLNDVDQLKDISNLRFFSLASNDLGGELPIEFFALPNLEELSVSHNQFGGKLPTFIGEMSNLRRFGCAGNQLTGQVPTEIGSLTNLLEFSASENQFEGTLPTELNNLINLETLSLTTTGSDRGIGGPLLAFRDLEQMTSLQLDDNRLTGSLPVDFLINSRRLDQRIDIGLTDNQLGGTVPSQWSRFDRLFVDLSGNLITKIASNLCSQSNWMGGTVSTSSCDVILCPKSTYNDIGRQTGSGTSDCQSCPSAQYLGAKECNGNDYNGGKGGDQSEVDILIEFYASTNGDSWTTNTGWGELADPCAWHGITCDGGKRVANIALVGNGLTGTPATSIFKLPSLQELYLSSNSISFDFSGINNAPKLISLFLSGTGMDNVNGIAIGGNSGILTLHLQDNNFVGAIPLELFLLTNLRELDMGFNQLTGTLPAGVKVWDNLETLRLQHNNLNGQLPAALGTMTDLRELNLAENNFDGTIPLELNDLTNLRFLTLQREGGVSGTGDVGVDQGASSVDGPGLTGTLPAFQSLPYIEKLFLGVNSISGSVPFNFLDGVQDKTAPISVDFTSNRLTGALPGSLSQFDRMALYVADNRISEIADGLCVKNAWMDGDVGLFQCAGILCTVNTFSPIGRNSCQSCPSGTNGYLGSFNCLSTDDHKANGERAIVENLYRQMNGDNWIYSDNWMDPDKSICTWYGITCVSDDEESVESISLVENELRHYFPTEVYSLPNLKGLNLQGNAIVMDFSGIGKAGKLEYLDLEYAAVASLAGISSANNLKLLRIDGNIFDTFPQEVFQLKNLEVLSMSENTFQRQPFPTDFQNFINLVYFACSECSFTGTIPTWLGDMAGLEYLKLDQNGLDGPLPVELEKLSNLKHLDLADQRSNGGGISGGVLGFADQTQLTELYLQHNDLAGAIPTTLLKGVRNDELVTVDLRFNALTGGIPTELTRINDLNIYVAANLITTLPTSICNKPWNDGNAQAHNCDGILCDKGYFNAYGRAIGDLDCIQCTEGAATFYGRTTCGAIFEHTILLGFYRQTDGPNWKSDGNWNRDDNHCTWEGIKCHEDGEFKGMVKEIDLGDNNMNGTPFLPLWKLVGLTYLDLRKNDVVISFSGVGYAKALDTVILSETKISSLEGIGAASSLISLHITNAELQGQIPTELYRLTNLQELFISHNALSGIMSTLVGELTALRDLYMFDNTLIGTLPTELGRLVRIEHLSLGHNKFAGPMPRQIMSLPYLQVLSLQQEQGSLSDDAFSGGLTGSLPALDTMPRLRELYLGFNSIDGTIPDHFLQGINDFTQPITVDLTNNYLSGAIPSSLAVFDDLSLFLAGNSIHQIPDPICDKFRWMNGEVANGCDAILCPPGTFNEFGRRVNSETLCEACTYPGSATGWGSTTCGPDGDDAYDDKTVLFELFEATGGPSWTNSKNWKKDNVPLCDWFGVTCEPVGVLGTLTVTELELESNNLHGIIPSIIFHLPELRRLNLGKNDVTITFNAIFQADQLEDLRLDETRVSELDGIGQATKLKILHLHRNSFGWKPIPDELFNLEGLTDLDLSDSRFGGTLSSKIGSLTNLLRLNLVSNDLSGLVPSEIGNLGSVEELMLSNNNFYGTLPESVSNLVSLKSFFLDNHKGERSGLTGPLRPFATMPGLRDFHFSDNQLTGTLPGNFLAGVSNPQDIINVYLDGNHLVGTVPPQLDAFEKLNIDLTGNLFTAIGEGLCQKSLWLAGTVGLYSCNAILCPPGEYSPAGRQTSMQIKCEPCPGAENSPYMGVSSCLSIQKKREREILQILFTATQGQDWKNSYGWLEDNVDICDWYGISCREGSTIESLLLGSNHLVGSLPQEIFQLPNLKFLWLYSNPMEFSFEGIAQATSLRSLLVDSTRLSSLQGIGLARSLIDLDVRFNQLAGKLPQEMENLTNLQSFTCADNALTGPVPEFAGNRRLNTLRMGSNMFTGSLPSFARHAEMKSLDVSESRLIGSIPSDFLETADVNQIMIIDLSENDLTGVVPGKLSRFSDLTIYLRDNRFSGIDPGLCLVESWNDGDVGTYQCDGIMCPAGTFSSSGRASRTGATCESCGKNKHLGRTTCGNDSASMPRFRVDASGWLITTALAIFGAVLY